MQRRRNCCPWYTLFREINELFHFGKKSLRPSLDIGGSGWTSSFVSDFLIIVKGLIRWNVANLAEIWAVLLLCLPWWRGWLSKSIVQVKPNSLRDITNVSASVAHQSPFLSWWNTHAMKFTALTILRIKFSIYALIYNICFSPSDLLHSVWQTLGPSTPLPMTLFHPF